MSINQGRLFLIGFGMILSTLISVSSHAAELSVAKSGNDSNPGTASAPFLTLQKAVSVAKPGDVITVQPGIYSGQVNLSASGTSTAKITLRAQYPATTSESNRSVLVGDTTTQGFYVTGKYWVIDGFEITNFKSAIFISTGGDFATVRENVIYENMDSGITCWKCNDSLIEKNQLSDLGAAYPEAQYAVMDYGVNFYYANNPKVMNNSFFGKFNHDISLKNNVKNALIAQNTFEGCMYQCIELGQNPDNSTEGDKTSQGAIVESNIFRDAVDGGTGAYYRVVNPITVMNIADVVIRNNFFENFLGSAAKVYYDAFEGDIRLGLYPGRVQFYGNTLFHPLSKDPHSGEAGLSRGLTVLVRQGNPEDVVEIDNNTLIGFYSVLYQQSGTQVIQKNTLQDSTQLEGPLTIDDPFINTGAHPAISPDWSRIQGFHLKSGSSAIDAGVNVGLPYTGSAPDLGSNEFIPALASSPSPTPSPAPAPAPSPAPADTTAPSTSITSPASGSTVPRNRTVTMTAASSDNVGVSKVEFFVNGKLVCTNSTNSSGSSSCNFRTANRRGVTYNLQTKAYDAAGNAGASLIVSVQTR